MERYTCWVPDKPGEGGPKVLSAWWVMKPGKRMPVIKRRQIIKLETRMQVPMRVRGVSDDEFISCLNPGRTAR